MDRSGAKVLKSRSGCGECRKKRMKCDESKPTCKNCAYRKKKCPGYLRDLKWSTKYERFRSSEQNSGVSGDLISPSSRGPNEALQTTATTAAGVTSGGDAEETVQQRLNVPVGEVGVILRTAEGRGTAFAEHQVSSVAAHTRRTTRLCIAEGGTSSPPASSADLAFQRATCLTREALLDESARRLCDVAAASDSTMQQVYYMTVPRKTAVKLEHEAASRLEKYYYDTACRIMSCYDSVTNPYRTVIPVLCSPSSALRNCMMGMSAAHMAVFAKDMAEVAIAYQMEAFKQMSSNLPGSRAIDKCLTTSTSTYEKLLGTIMLGMTSAWHDLTKHGMEHLRGARSLFEIWATEQAIVNSDRHARLLNREQSFIVGSMAYWECLAAFISDQSLDDVAYLAPFLGIAQGQTVYPHPWTGLSTPIFVLMTQVGILLRQKRMLNKLLLVRNGACAKEQLEKQLVLQARDILEAVKSYTPPTPDNVEETADERTPLSHLYDVAKAYRYAAISELFQAFPILAVDPTNMINEPARTHDIMVTVSNMTFTLASAIMSIICGLPRDSGTFTVLGIAMISAGSAMQSQPQEHEKRQHGADSITMELAELQRGRPALTRLRTSLKEQIRHASRRLGIPGIARALQLVQGVWDRSDMRRQMSAQYKAAPMIHWVDVMTEERLETLYG
ncbi:putative zn(2)-C6 fungal-type DNA-binding domain, fungal transcription factor [Septoria linicola]|nr:putative zn(2)-C6 fungal-type DNA-binding domain, fungal transcription factor [Septoria linicola]